jgi:hypothetical protein
MKLTHDSVRGSATEANKVRKIAKGKKHGQGRTHDQAEAGLACEGGRKTNIHMNAM